MLSGKLYVIKRKMVPAQCHYEGEHSCVLASKSKIIIKDNQGHMILNEKVPDGKTWVLNVKVTINET